MNPDVVPQQEDHATRASLQSIVQTAISNKVGYIKLPSGTFKTQPSIDPSVHIAIQGARDLVIDGTGTTLLATTLTRAVNIANSSNLTLKGLTIDYDPLPFTQGTVIAVASDNTTVDIKLDVGYPQILLSRARFLNNVTYREKDGTSFP